MPRFRLLLPLLFCAGLFIEARAEGHLFLDPRVSFDLRDVQTGIQLGDEEILGKLRLSGFLDAEFRPLPRGTRVRVAETQEYTVRHAWYSVGPGAGAAWEIASGAFLTAAGGASRAFGGGVGDGWAGWVDAGVRFPIIDESYWALLYQYHPSPREEDHRRELQFRFRAL